MGIADISVLVIFFIFALILIIPVLIGVYVYRDAKKRNMNAALWTLIAVLAPAFVGLIIFLIARGEHSDLACPQCSEPVMERYTVCPKCGAPLKNRCANCGYAVEPGWKICPGCAQPLPEDMKPVLEHQKNDKGLGKILIAVIAIPIILCIVIVIGLVTFSSQYNVSSQTAGGMYKEDFANNEAVANWLLECDNNEDGIYVLQHKTNNGDEKNTTYLVYRKGVTGQCEMHTSTIYVGTFSKPVLRLDYDDTGVAAEDNYDLYLVSYIAEYQPGLKVFINGEKVGYSLVETEEPIYDWEAAGEDPEDIEEESILIQIRNTDNIPVQSAGITVYHNGEAIRSEGYANADGSALSGVDIIQFSIAGAEYYNDTIDYVISLYDNNGEEILSKKYTASKNYKYVYLILTQEK